MIRSSPRTAKRKRAEQKVIQSVRPIVAKRDGHCRIWRDWILSVQLSALNQAAEIARIVNELGVCGGPSEWAHLGEFKRFKTRKQAPELRHSTQHTAMLCGAHHDAYDANQFVIEELTEDGADGPLAYRLKDSK